MKEVHLIVNRFKSFIRQQQGAITIEFLLITIVLLLILVFMADLAILRSNLGKLDNATYSLVNILRERTQLHNNSEEITANEADQFKKLAKKLIYDDVNTQKEISVILESLSFATPRSAQDDPAATYKTFGDNNSDCKPYMSLNGLKSIAPRSESKNGRKIPLYQITICIPNYSLFKAVTLNDRNQSKQMIRSSSATVSR
ncbi:tight adherence protein F [Bisgaardia hudsonensis]|uniref:Tight adherence protein F n=1 Tax=Bisgaardia hudsonensis TaxID=109472 RepID=A0A4R2MX70_9PAST|nr:tight adherence pilus pseudopilin TadF [Bisgaardia hudsonensis]QLB12347.1 hypothetical protein A6A11_01310 [Bisgaardia hudsonensis]TCP12395.1 tight adherence protein F [Bisgaardia hudsonensis]